MLAFDSAIEDAANQGHLPEAARFSIQRLAELLGPGTHFSASAAFVLTPLDAARELKTLATDYGAPTNDFPKRAEVARACQWVKKALANEPNLRHWYGSEYNAALQR